MYLGLNTGESFALPLHIPHLSNQRVSGVVAGAPVAGAPVAGEAGEVAEGKYVT